MSCLVRNFSKRGVILLLGLITSLGTAWAANVSETEYSVHDSLQMAEDDKVQIVCYRDFDADGYGNPAIFFTNATAVICPAGYTSNNLDCNDASNAIHPNAVETCNSVDDDCDGVVDDGFPAIDQYADIDGDGFGDVFSQYSGSPVCFLFPGFVANFDDCNDFDVSVFPGQAEACNGQDDNCDGVIDEGLASITFYADFDGDGFGDDLNTQNACAQPFNFVAAGGDCDDSDPFNFPGNAEACDGLDNDCDGVVDNGAGTDADGDGWSTCQNDCDDTNPLMNPGEVEVCDGLDNDCNGGVDEGFDADFDGFTVCQNDCDELNPFINPSIVEVCDGIDQNCDGVVDDGFDVDADGFTTCAGDCNDADPTVFPGAVEICDAIDNNCDTQIDEGALLTFYADVDGDSFGDNANTTTACAAPAGFVTDNTDCNDADAGVNPAAAEICDGVDNNCDTQIDEGVLLTFYADADGDTFGDNANTTTACAAPAGFVADNTDCNDADATINPSAAEICDGVDNNCDTQIDEGFDVDGDGFSACAGDCNDADPTVFPGAVEICDAIDNNCDTQIDEGALLTFYADVDGDSFGDNANTTTACAAPAGFVTDNTDCNDADAGVNPAAAEICDGVDNNCDTQIDEGVLLTFYADADGDTFGDNANTTTACAAPAGFVADNTDCNDADATINPSAAEICDGVDNNCDTQIDEGFDVDGDGFSACAGDCDDNNNTVFPGAIEICDGIDNNCDTQIDEGVLQSYFVDADSDGYGEAGSVATLQCAGAAGFADNDLDCDDTDALINPAAIELCNTIDDNCDGTIDEGFDLDGDGALSCDVDCDDTNPLVNGFLPEVCDGIDNNCDLVIDEGFDLDFDGVTVCNGDCDDTNDAIFTGAPEICDGLDNNCDTQIDEGVLLTFYADVDGDTFGDNGNSTSACVAPVGFVADNTDCNDADAAINPAAVEICDGIDNNCDTQIDEGLLLTFYADVDGDAYGDIANSTTACTAPIGFVADNTDCNDADPAINPAAIEICDGIDNNCDTQIDEGGLLTFYADLDGDTFGDLANSFTGCAAPAGFVADNTDCNDADASVNPAAIEICDAIDNNCDTQIDEGFDVDGDGVTTCAGDCDDSNNAIFPGAAEICDGLDNNCDTQIDEGVLLTFYADLDGDTFGDIANSTTGCVAPLGFVADNTDCNDADAAINPAAIEICDAIDNNCDTQIDEGFDLDGDGVTTCAGDCDDNNINTFPGAIEICDVLDNDCNGLVDENLVYADYYLDADLDGYGDVTISLNDCTAPAGYVQDNTDCNDADATINGSAVEICDGIDQDCDGVIDNGVPQVNYFEDLDGDGFGNDASFVQSCAPVAGYTLVGGDCDDSNAAVNPLGTEICDGLDNNCDGTVDEGLQIQSFLDADNDGFGDPLLDTLDCAIPAGYVANATDCDDADAAVNPGALDICGNGIDEDCSGSDSTCLILGCIDPTACNFDPLATQDDGTCVLPSPEVCDGIDNDCNTLIDDGLVFANYFQDNDGDAFGDLLVSISACSQPVGFVIDSTDCDDANAGINPLAIEVCDNGIDEDCSGSDSTCIVLGCTDLTACNFNPLATQDDGTCVLPTLDICGNGIDEDCNGSDSICVVLGCTDATACNFDPLATLDDGTCVLPTAEICDGLDNDCNTLIDDGLTISTYYADSDGDGFGDLAVFIDSCAAPSGYVLDNTDCNDFDALINPGAIEDCNTIDDNCDGNIDEGFDLDADGVTTCQGDCDDTNPAINALAVEICDGLDNDCNGGVDEGFDQDFDGFTTCQNDCDDLNDQIFPGATEICGNGIDEDCDGVDSPSSIFYADVDGDGFGDLTVTKDTCSAPIGYVADSTDCNDADAGINPSVVDICDNGIDEDCSGADSLCAVLGCTDATACNFDPLATLDDGTCVLPTAEICDGLDNDCNTLIDDGLTINTYYADNDGDGFGDAAVTIDSCAAPSGYVLDNTDCNDFDALINPGAIEDCNTIDDNCDGNIDEGFDLDADGVTTCQGDCDDTNPAINALAVEICDGLDNDCNGGVDEGFDQDFDGFTTCQNDCDDLNDQIFPGATEICGNGIDEDCDGVDSPSSIFYADVDGDGFGDLTVTKDTCSAPIGYVADSTDCNDADAGINPSILDICDNGIDEDCSGADSLCAVLGCTDATACNFDPLATLDDGTCILPIAEICDGLDNDCNTLIDDGLIFTNYYQDADADGFGNPLVVINACSQPAGYVIDNTDCNDANAALTVSTPEICDGIDNDCDGTIDNGLVYTDYYQDADGDGFGNPAVVINACSQPAGYVTDNTDCNDSDAAINTAAAEICDGIDNNCNTLVDDGLAFVNYYQDADGDGFGNPAVVINACSQPAGYVVDNTDCNDANVAINTAATEICDGIDNNCNTLVDDGLVFTNYYQDADLDGFGNPLVVINACSQPAGYVIDNTDCNDANAALTVSTLEICDGIDNDCDGTIDNGLVFTNYYQDADADGFGNIAVVINACTQPAGYVTNSTDCDDANAAINTAAAEICDGIDNNCNTLVDDGLVFTNYYQDADADGFGNPLVVINACSQPVGYVTNNTDCNDLNPALTISTPETCDGIDNDCDGTIDNGLVFTNYYQDADADGFGNIAVVINACTQPAGYVTNSTDCNDANAAINTAAAEICDGIDNNCNTLVDDGLLFTNYYQDADTDGFGNPLVFVSACAQPAGYVTNSTDCNDANAAINTAAAEICDGIDNNCNTLVDDGLVFINYYQDADADGFGNPLIVINACSQPVGYVTNNTDCNDLNPALTISTPETCDGIDNDCDGTIDNGLVFTNYYQDADADGFGNIAVVINACTQPAGYVTNSTDCNDANAAINTAAAEICDGIDNNCNTLVDDGLVFTNYYQDADADGFGNPLVVINACSQPAGYVTNNTDCNDLNPALTISTPETCDGIDNDCDGTIDNGLVFTNYYQDADADGFGNIAVVINACTQPAGYVTNSTDCNDANAAINTAAAEVCDGIDNNCNTLVDDGLVFTNYYQDADTDGFGNPLVFVIACAQPVGYVTNSTDCNDANAAINTAAAEICDGIDNNCNTLVDDGLVFTNYYQDLDVDGFGNPLVFVNACAQPAGYVTNSTDCNDANAAINTAAAEICDGIDNNCNTLVDDGLVFTNYYQDLDGDGFGNVAVVINACAQPAGYVTNSTDCNDADVAVNTAATEICDGIDNNCNTQIDEGVQNTYYADVDGDGFGDAGNTILACSAPIGYVVDNTDCDDTNNAIFPGATEICDGFDNNCDGQIDEGVLNTYYADADGDGFGDIATTTTGCTAPIGYVADNTDCDDTNAAINTDAVEICDLIDNNCDGQIDEGLAVTPSVTITADFNPVCQNSTVSFTAIPVNEGINPVYQWMINGVVVGTNASVFSSNTLVNGDTVTVMLTADNLCQTVADTISNEIVMVVDSIIAPTVTIVSNDTICAASTNTFVMSIDQPGTSPQYTWLLNGIDQGVNSPNFTSNTIVDGDQLIGIVNTSNACLPLVTASDTIVFTVLNPVTPTISLFYVPNDSICQGDVVDFLADVTDGGPNPIVTWLINGIDIGWTGTIYSTGSLVDGDQVQVQLTANNLCQISANAVSTIVPIAVGTPTTYYVDADGDGAGDVNNSLVSCFQPNGYVPTPGDCDDTDPTVGICVDADGDGYTDNVDCNDNDPSVNPGAIEICGNAIDENCDGINYLIWYWDADGDGLPGTDSVFYSWSCDTLVGFYLDPVVFDCNDYNATVYQGAPEICDNLDNDCNTFIDDGVGVWWFYDGDLDGFGVADSMYFLCYPPSPYWTDNAADCDDTDPLLTPVSDNDGDGFLGCVNDCDDMNPAINPTASEICDDVDNDCDGQIDEGIGFVYYADLDGDGFGGDKDSIFSCDTIPPAGYAANNLDCNDGNYNVNPSVEEICGNVIDDNCDGIAPEECTDENPDGFSPDGDGQGDEFVLDYGQRDTQLRLEVYNRWGSKVFESSALGRLTWDGKPNVGKQQEQCLPVGTYFAIIEINGEVKTQTITIWK